MNLLEAKHLALVRKVPATYRTRIPCSCKPDPDTNLRDKSCKCKGRGWLPGESLLAHPACIDSAIRCQEGGCGTLLVRASQGWVCPSKQHGKSRPDFIVSTTIAQIFHAQGKAKLLFGSKLDKKVNRDTKRWLRLLKGRGRYMYKFGLKESSIGENS